MSRRPPSPFKAGKLLFLRGWSYVYGLGSTPGSGNKVAGKSAMMALSGPRGPCSPVLGGPNLSITAFATHRRAAVAFLASGRKVQEDGSMPPMRTRLCESRLLLKRCPSLACARAGNPRGKAAPGNQQLRPAQPGYSECETPGAGNRPGGRCNHRGAVGRAEVHPTNR